LWTGGSDSAGEDIPYNPEHIVQLAVGPTKSKESKDGTSLIVPERTGILAEIISGDAFGVDRADYLLRDSYHLGVAYGQFDLHRLIDTLVVLPAPGPLNVEEGEEEPSREPGVGIEEGGLQVAEALAVARYAMYSQVYFHPIRRIYDKHLTDFLRNSLEDGVLPIDTTSHLGLTDVEIMSSIRQTAHDGSLLGHDPAKRILGRGHFRVLWNNNEVDKLENPSAVKVIAQEAAKVFGEDAVHVDEASVEMQVSFRVLQSDGNVVPATTISNLISQVPNVEIQRVYVAPERFSEAEEWWKEHRLEVLQETPAALEDELVEEESSE
jgi:HD superfamily phosphohydrolase